MTTFLDKMDELLKHEHVTEDIIEHTLQRQLGPAVRREVHRFLEDRGYRGAATLRGGMVYTALPLVIPVKQAHEMLPLLTNSDIQEYLTGLGYVRVSKHIGSTNKRVWMRVPNIDEVRKNMPPIVWLSTLKKMLPHYRNDAIGNFMRGLGYKKYNKPTKQIRLQLWAVEGTSPREVAEWARANEAVS